MKKIKRILLLALVVVMILTTFTACGTRTCKFKFQDGSKHIFEINYDKVGALARWPHFKESNSRISMSFNGETWYSASIVDADSVAKFVGDTEPIATTTNMKVYYTDSPYYIYSYLMDIDTEGHYFLKFDTNQGPDGSGYGNDFDTGIRYYLDGEELIPDVPKVVWHP